MDKISSKDMVNLPDKKEELIDSGEKPLKKNMIKEHQFIGEIRKALKKIKAFLRNCNIYRKIRESFVVFYLSKTVSAKKKDLSISWQPPLWVLFKISIVAVISYKFYELHKVVGSWLKAGLDFFKLHEIYNFTFPPRSFFDTVAGYLFLFVIAYHGVYFLYHQVQALFSVLVIDKADKKVYYIKDFFIKKDLFIFSIPEIALVVLKQNIVSRLFGLGTISLQKNSGEQVVIRTVQRAHALLKDLTRIRNEHGENEKVDK